MQSGPCIVGVGASAGGFDAIKKLLSTMAPGNNLAFVVIQHLDPSHKSLAPKLFAKHTRMTVVQAEEGVRVQADHVYTLPSGHDATIRDGVLHLSAPEQRHGLRLPIDHFLRSLGEDQQQRAIGIILSGTGADGALGLKSVVANGGIVLVQRPETAQFDGMPRAAIATGLATHALNVEDMAEVLTGYARHPYAVRPEQPTSLAEAQAPLVGTIFDLVRTRHGYDFTGYKRATLLRRIHRRMGLRHVESMAEYAAAVSRDPHELDALFKDLLIGVTEFFRDPEAWQALETDVIGPLVAGHDNDQPIRVWVPGVSTGEEAYSVAMLLLEKLEAAGKRCQVQIFATDTSEDALAIARMGRYPAGIAARIPPARLQRFFNEIDDEHRYQVTSELRECVVFGLQNLFSDPPFSGVDLVTCRNVLIYLEPDTQKRVILLLHFALRPDGFLFLGGAETVGQAEDLFKPVSRKWHIYRRTNTTPPEQLELHVRRAGLRAGTAGFHARRPASLASAAASLAQRIILDRFAPASVLVDQNFQALYFCGHTDRFLLRPRGTPTHDLLSLAREGLRTRLRGALREAASANTSVVVKDARIKRDGAYELVRLTVAPAGSTEMQNLLLVVFEDEPAAPAGRRSAGESKLVKQLEEELVATRDDLHDTIERLETSNEELKVANEQVVSINQELQASNEELQSSKEELQSLNEELNTVNQQLQTKLGELETANNDLKNVLASSDVATLCLDPDLRIKWFSPAARNVLALIANDVGRPVNVFGAAPMGESLVSDSRTVLDKLEPVQHEAKSAQGRWYLRRILPYRADGDRVEGVIATFTDITESKLAAESMLDSHEAMTASLAQRVEERTRQLRALAFELTRAEESERRAIARDLHDDLGQVLSAAKLKLTGLLDEKPDPDRIRTLREVEKLIDHANRSIRSLAFQLSPAVLYELGLVPALEWLAEEMKRMYGLSVAVTDDGAPKPLSQAIRAILFRAVRELLINVGKHAGVGDARVVVRRAGDKLIVTVSDTGVGFDPTTVDGPRPRGFGLISVRERLSFIGGSADIASVPGDGSQITLTAPLQPTEQPTEERPQ